MDAPYLSNYEKLSLVWKLAVGEVESERVVIILQRSVDTWSPYSMVPLSVTSQYTDADRKISVLDDFTIGLKQPPRIT